MAKILKIYIQVRLSLNSHYSILSICLIFESIFIPIKGHLPSELSSQAEL